MQISYIFTALTLLCKAFTLWLAFVALRWFFLKKPKLFPAHEAKTKFAILIAARNEETVIGRTVRYLLASDYPRELFDVYVIPNNCTDDTRKAALEAGAKIIDCKSPIKLKGDALREATELLRDSDYDTFCFFDADNVVDKKFLQRLNDAFEDGAQVVKGRHAAINPRESWVAGCYDIYFSSFDLVFNRPRANGILSCKLIGTGFAIKKDLLFELGGWRTDTIAEDTEFAAIVALNNIRVRWVADAMTYDEEVLNFRTSIIQRKRWCSGVMQVGKKIIPQLFKEKPSLLRFDMFILLATPYAQVVSFMLTLCATLSGIIEGNMPTLGSLAFSVGSYCVGIWALALALQLYDRPKERRNMKAVLGFPLFMASWLPLQFASIFHKTTKWRETRHFGRMLPPDEAQK